MSRLLGEIPKCRSHVHITHRKIARQQEMKREVRTGRWLVPIYKLQQLSFKCQLSTRNLDITHIGMYVCAKRSLHRVEILLILPREGRRQHLWEYPCAVKLVIDKRNLESDSHLVCAPLFTTQQLVNLTRPSQPLKHGSASIFYTFVFLHFYLYLLDCMFKYMLT